MTNRFISELSYGRRLLLASAAVLVIAGPIAVGLLNPQQGRAQTQTAAARPKFEVASVKLAGPPGPLDGCDVCGGPGSKDPGEITWRRTELMSVLGRAYKVPVDQISGPDWLNTQIYAIFAKIPPNTNEDRFDLMLQYLLAERFNLKLHRSTRDFPGYELVVANGGPKMKGWRPGESAPEVAPADATYTGKFDKDGFPTLPPGATQIIAGVNDTVRSTFRTTMAAFVTQLGMLIDLSNGEGGRTPRVVDKTGLAGKFEFKLEFAKGSIQPEAGGASVPAGGPTLFTALEGQLGLKLKKVKGVTEDLLVIDHIDKVPTEN